MCVTFHTNTSDTNVWHTSHSTPTFLTLMAYSELYVHIYIYIYMCICAIPHQHIWHQYLAHITFYTNSSDTNLWHTVNCMCVYIFVCAILQRHIWHQHIGLRCVGVRWQTVNRMSIYIYVYVCHSMRHIWHQVMAHSELYVYIYMYMYFSPTTHLTPTCGTHHQHVAHITFYTNTSDTNLWRIFLGVTCVGVWHASYTTIHNTAHTLLYTTYLVWNVVMYMARGFVWGFRLGVRRPILGVVRYAVMWDVCPSCIWLRGLVLKV